MHDFFFFNDTATTEIYTLSLHDALPICTGGPMTVPTTGGASRATPPPPSTEDTSTGQLISQLTEQVSRSEEHTSELQSRQYLVCRLLLEKKKNKHTSPLIFYRD